MVTMRRISDAPYEIAYEHAEIRHIANEAKSIPREWINDAGNDVTQPLIDYLSPLILGEVPVKYESGIPVYMDVSHFSKTSINLPISTHALFRFRQHFCCHLKDVEHSFINTDSYFLLPVLWLFAATSTESESSIS